MAMSALSISATTQVIFPLHFDPTQRTPRQWTGASEEHTGKGGDHEGISWSDAVYLDQEATRVIRTHQYSYWKRMKGTGKNELYDMQKDPMQENDLYGNPDHAEVVSELDRRLTQFFDTYSNADYDLWRGGTVKGTSESTQVYRSLYGEQWKPESKVKPAFRENIR